MDVHKRYIKGIAFYPESSLLASASEDKTVKLWDLADGSLIKTIKASHYANCVDFNPDGQYLAFGSESSEIKIYKTDDYELLRTIM